MPIDAGIYGNSQVQPTNPLQTLAQVYALRGAQQNQAINQQELELRRQQIQSQIEQRDTAVAKAQQDAADREGQKQEDADLSAYLSSGQHIEESTLRQIVSRHPARADAILTGMEALKQQQIKTAEQARTAGFQALTGLQALPEDQRATWYPVVRDWAVNTVGVDDKLVPKDYSPGWTAFAIRSMQSGEQQEAATKPKIQGFGGDQNLVDTNLQPGQTPTVLMTTPTEKPKPQTEADFVLGKYGPNPTTAQKLQGHADWAKVGREGPQPSKFDTADFLIKSMFGDHPTAEQAQEGLRLHGEAQRGVINFDQKNLAGVDPTIGDAYATALARATSGGNVTQPKRNAINMSANALAKRGDLKQLGEVIGQAAVESENVDQRNLIRGRVGMRVSLGEISQVLKDMQAAGAPTGKLTGNAEELAQWATGQTTNPKLAALGTRLGQVLVNYRRATTGVQFSEAEAKTYDKMFPGWALSTTLNLARIDGLLDQISTDDATYWYGKIGTSGMKLIQNAIRPDTIGWPKKDDTPGDTQNIGRFQVQVTP